MTIYEALFGTPERAAKTLVRADLNAMDYCFVLRVLSDDEYVKCKNCPYECDNYVCEPRDITYLEWLQQEVVE